MADRYKIYERLGEGGVGAVFRAYDTQLKRWVAIKRLFAEPGDETDTDELRREADALASLRNANIVTIFDVASDAEGMFLVMELLEGEDLSDVIEKSPLSFDDFKELASQTLEGLMSAHHIHILHRDIKPENIKIERLPGGRLQSKIIDFGLARAGLKARKQTESDLGTVMGSIFYMAPEQLTRSPVDERSDLYSLHRLVAKSPDDRPAGAQQAIEEFRAWEKGPGSLAFGGWTAPLVPTSEKISPATSTGTGNQALAALASPQRPVHRSAARSSAAAARPTPPASAVRSSALQKPQRKTRAVAPGAAATGDNPMKTIGLIGGGILAAVVVLWMMFSGGDEDKIRPKGRPSTPSTSASKTKAPAKKSTTQAAAPSNPNTVGPNTPSILPADICAHFIAGEKSLTEGGKPASVGDSILKWGDLASRGGDNALEASDSKATHAPVLADWTGGALKSGLKAVDFRPIENNPKQLRVAVGGAQLAHFPKGPGTSEGPKGVTMAVVFQAVGGKPPQRVLFLGGGRGEAGMIRVDGKNSTFGVAKLGKATTQLPGGAAKGNSPSVAILSWSAGGDVFFISSDANGRRNEKTAAGRPMPEPLTQIELGKVLTTDGKTVGTTEQFRGLIAEVVVYASALSKENARKLEKELRARYFAKP